jgi:hypothetical protein
MKIDFVSAPSGRAVRAVVVWEGGLSPRRKAWRGRKALARRPRFTARKGQERT